MKKLFLSLAATVALTLSTQAQSWTADNGNGTFTNPLFYDEFSDPDILRVGDDYYLAGTTMHAVPGLVILHSKDRTRYLGTLHPLRQRSLLCLLQCQRQRPAMLHQRAY